MTGLYIHVPFCKRKCNYCDFYSQAAAEKTAIVSYIKGIAMEGKLLGQKVPTAFLAPVTMYFGGGTPSILTVNQLSSLFNAIKTSFDLSKAEELTLEINPDTVTKEKLSAYLRLGINRLSVGVQSFNDQDLATMGRSYPVSQVRKLFRWIRELDLPNFSLDMIYGLPGQTLADWEKNLEKAMEVSPHHISLYGLKIEEGTLWGKMLSKGEISLPDDESQADMYLLAVKLLNRAGYEQYEISNFAKPGYYSRHNLLYWQNSQYFGIGPGASSHYNNKRWSNVADIDKYYQLLNKGHWPTGEKEQLDRSTIEAETIFLGLRLTEGINVYKINEKLEINFLNKYQNQLNKLVQQGLLQIKNDYVKLTTHGMLLSNQVFSEFLPFR